jgi:uncharacterized protein YydD (DUF2326 family)
MKLAKIYSNKDSTFSPVFFNEGLNVVLGEIHLPENRDKDTHNLGKSKLAEIIDFCFLKKRNSEQFLFKHINLFESFIFFLEVELNNGGYLTIKRSVSSNTKIYIKKHSKKHQDFTGLDDGEWDYEKISITNAGLLLDALFSLKSVSPWSYRNTINYALRSQGDFKDIFKLSNFIGKHLYWKPYVGKNLGFNSDDLKISYELQYDIEQQEDYLSELLKEVGDFQGDQEETLNGLLAIKQDESVKIQSQLDTFNFGDSDSEAIKRLSTELNEEISELNKMKYYFSSNLKKLRNTLEKGNVEFNISLTKKIFEEAGILFNEQVKTSYDDLLEFNRKITVERQVFVKQQIHDLNLDIDEINSRLKILNEKKSKNLIYLNSTDTFDKYKELTSYLVLVNTEINEIKYKLSLSEKIKEKQKFVRKLKQKRNKVVERIRIDREKITKDEDSVYALIKNNFITFVKKVIDKNGFISTKQNGEGNLEFYAGIIDDNGKYTSEADGHSYKKILCIGYDLAIIQAYSSSEFVRFVYHDGPLETLDERKKVKFIEHVRRVTENKNIQYILTVIDSDLPQGVQFHDDEVVLTLHDNGAEGRLFKMPSW